MNSRIDQLAIKTLGSLAVEAINKAKSGHPGIALGAAPMIHTVYSRCMNISSSQDKWINRDRFVMSAGHGSALLYSMLHLCDYITIDDLKGFRSLNSITPGHPEVHLTKGVDVSSGPLGQGFASAVGLAISEEHLRAKFPKLINHYTYVLCGDGDLQEGVTQEAASLAGNLGLSKLIVLFDSNDIQLDGPVNMANSEKTKEKFEGMNWNYLLVKDGTNVEDIYQALQSAQKSTEPTIIEVKTIIGFGAKNQGTSSVHGSPLSTEEVENLRKDLGMNAFEVSEEVRALYRQVTSKGEALYQEWEATRLAVNDQLFEDMVNDNIVIDFEKDIMKFDASYNSATRVSSGAIMKQLNALNPMLIGGSADLTSSTNISGGDGEFSKTNRLGRNLKFGVREHAMAAISNGIALHGGLRPFCSGFFVFADYMKPAIRLSAIMDLPVIYIFTHDSVAVGEDGPTHQPIEQLTMLRSIPNVNVIRPADANEVKEAYKIALASKKNPTVIVLTRQNLPTIVSEADSKVALGGYVVNDIEGYEGILIATGSEVSLALEAQKLLAAQDVKVRVVSLPSTSLFDKQGEKYQDKILPPFITKRLAIEMSEGAHLYKYTGLFGRVYSINEFGKSGKGPEVVASFGYDAKSLAQAYLALPKIDITRYLK
jgi:transketolase